MTDNLGVNSRRCLNFPAAHTRWIAREPRSYLGLRLLNPLRLMAAVLLLHRFRVAREFSGRGRIQTHWGWEQENCHRIVSARSNASQEFETAPLLLNFVNSVGWGRVPRSRGFDFKQDCKVASVARSRDGRGGYYGRTVGCFCDCERQAEDRRVTHAWRPRRRQ